MGMHEQVTMALPIISAKFIVRIALVWCCSGANKRVRMMKKMKKRDRTTPQRLNACQLGLTRFQPTKFCSRNFWPHEHQKSPPPPLLSSFYHLENSWEFLSLSRILYSYMQDKPGNHGKPSEILLRLPRQSFISFYFFLF